MAVSCLGLSSFAADEPAGDVPGAVPQQDGLLIAAAVVPADLAPLISEAASLLNVADFFRGTDKGLELDRAPSRAEAATMLVRMLGAETAASSEKNTHPFADVKATSVWASDNIGYLYKNGLTKGVSDVKFGDRDLVIAKQFYTFCLRALGYADGQDFAYDDAVAKAAELGVITPEVAAAVNAKANFTRGDMALAMFSALKAKPKGAEKNLADTLTEKGSVSVFSSEIVNGTNELFNFMKDAGGKTDKVNFTASLTAKIDITAGLTKTSSEMTGKMLYDVDVAAPSMKMYADMSVKDGEETVATLMYMDNTKMYVKSEGKWEAIPTDVLDVSALMKSMNQAAPLDIGVGSFYKDLKMTKAGGEVTVSGKADISSILNSPIMKNFGEMTSANLFNLGSVDLNFVYDEASKELKSAKMKMTMDIPSEGTASSIAMDIDMKVSDYGKTVITLEKDLQDLIAKK